MRSILDKAFRYVPSYETDIKDTFARIRREQRKQQKQEQERQAEQQHHVVSLIRNAKG